MATSKKKQSTIQHDDLTKVIADSLNNTKDGMQRAFLGKEDNLTNVKQFFSTGCTELDIMLSNRKNGGIPTGRIIEFLGLEGSGKSMVSAHVIANAQKRGAYTVLFDTEFAVNQEFFSAIGVDFDKLILVHPRSVEETFENLEKIVEIVRTKKDIAEKGVVIVIDSMSALPANADLEAGYELEGFRTQKPRLLSMNIPKILRLIAEENISLIITNQYRMKMNPMPNEDKYTTSGGMATRYYASLRVAFSIIGKITVGENQAVGVKIKAKSTKSRFGGSQQTCEFDVYFDRGIDNNTSLLKTLKKIEIVEVNGAWYSYTDNAGKQHKFQAKDFGKLIEENEALKEELIDKATEALVMTYSTANVSTEGEGTKVEVQTESNDLI